MSVAVVIDLASASAVAERTEVELDIATAVPGIEIGLPGPQGPKGDPGILVLDPGAPIPPGTPEGTVILRR